MAQPFNYNIASPMAAFEGSFNFAQAQEQKQRAEQAAREKQAQQIAEQQRVQTALESISRDRSPENLAKNLLLVPSIKEQVLASESILNEAEKTANNQFRAEVIGLAKSGNIEAARLRLQKQAEGYAGTVGKEKEAAAAQALLKTFDINPESVILPMSIQLAESNKDLYKTLFDTGELTAFQKSLVAANIDPKSPRGIALAENFAVNQADPLVEIMTPNNTKFVGPRSEYFRRYGPNAPPPSEVAPVEAIQMLLTGQGTEAEFDAIFGKGKAAEYLKLKGVSGSNTTGNFQGK